MLTDRQFKGLALFTATIAIATSFAFAIATLQPGARARVAGHAIDCTAVEAGARCATGGGA